MLNTQEYAQLEWESRINSKSVGAKGNPVHSQFGNGATPVILEAIVASNQYKLMDRFHDNFRASTNNNAESIFEIQYSVNDGASGGENGNIGSTLNYPYGGGGVTTCCGFFQPSQNVVNAFKTDANGLPLLDAFNKDGDDVNQIRKRAANPDGFVKNADGTNAANYLIKEYTAPWTDKATAQKAVQFEQRLEFAMEGHRRFDLVRWGIADQTLNAYYSSEAKKRTYLVGVQFTKGKHEYFPIPLQEILNSQKGGQATLKQNPGY